MVLKKVRICQKSFQKCTADPSKWGSQSAEESSKGGIAGHEPELGPEWGFPIEVEMKRWGTFFTLIG